MRTARAADITEREPDDGNNVMDNMTEIPDDMETPKQTGGGGPPANHRIGNVQGENAISLLSESDDEDQIMESEKTQQPRENYVQIVTPAKLESIIKGTTNGILKTSKTSRGSTGIVAGREITFATKGEPTKTVTRRILEIQEKITYKNHHEALKIWGWVLSPDVDPARAANSMIEHGYVQKNFVNAKEAKGEESLKSLKWGLSPKLGDARRMEVALRKLANDCPEESKGLLEQWLKELKEVTANTASEEGDLGKKQVAMKERSMLVTKILSYLSTREWALTTAENPIEIHLFDLRTDTSIKLISPPARAGVVAMTNWYKTMLGAWSRSEVTNETGDPRRTLSRNRKTEFNVPGTHRVDWKEGVVIVANRPVPGSISDETLNAALKRQLTQRGWTRLILMSTCPPENDPAWKQLDDLIKSGNGYSGVDPTVAEEVTKMIVEAVDLYGISDPKVVLERSGKPFLVDNFFYETPHKIRGVRKAKSGLCEYLKTFDPISITTQLKEKIPEEEEDIVGDETAPGRFILTPVSRWKVSGEDIETAEIVRFLGHPVESTKWEDSSESGRPKGYRTRKVCTTKWSRGHEGWDLPSLIEAVQEMSKSEKTMISFSQQLEETPVAQKRNGQKNLKHGPSNGTK